MRKILRYTLFIALALLALPSLALAEGENTTLALPTVQLWALAAGAFAPVVGYLVNYAAPWTSEKVKAVIFIAAAAVSGAITQAITNGTVGFNDATFQLVVTAVIAAISTHFGFWKPSTISTSLGGGRNKQEEN